MALKFKTDAERQAFLRAQYEAAKQVEPAGEADYQRCLAVAIELSENLRPRPSWFVRFARSRRAHR